MKQDDGRSPHGERGLKFKVPKSIATSPGRSPHGERGLKLKVYLLILYQLKVALLTESVD